MAYQTGRRRMGWLNPAPWDEVRQGQSPPPDVGRPLNTERYQSRADMLRERGFTNRVQSTGDPEQDAAQVSEAQEAVYQAFPMFRNFGIRVKDFRRDDAVNQQLRERGISGGIEFNSGWDAGPKENPRPFEDYRPVDQNIRNAKEGNLGLAIPPHNATSGRGPYWDTIEIYAAQDNPDPETGEAKSLSSAIAGDMLHHLSSKDQDGNYVEDRFWAPQYQALLEQFDKTVRDTPSKFNPEVTQLEEDRRLWERRTKDDETKRSFDDYWEYSGRDAWVRGYLFPDERDEMRRQDWYTDEQIGILDQMLSLMRGQE